MKRNYFLCLLLLIFFDATGQKNSYSGYTGTEYIQLKSALTWGWNTWNTNSILSHVLLPEAISIDFYLKDKSGQILKDALIGRVGKGTESIVPFAHTDDGAYTELMIEWHDIKLRIQSCASGRDISFLITPLNSNTDAALLVTPQKIWWNRQGNIKLESNQIMYSIPSGNLIFHAYGEQLKGEADTAWYLAFSAGAPIALTTKFALSVEEITVQILAAKKKYEEATHQYGDSKEVYNAMQNVLGWDMIYEPEGHRALTTVSRLWNGFRGGFVIFCWDNYFVSYMHSLNNKELAYANAIEITNSITGDGFVPNLSASMGIKSYDRSQPPVGSFVVREIYRHYKEKWFLQEVFSKLLTWNRWWPKNRDKDGFLCWGSSEFEPHLRNLDKNAHSRFGAALESGLDNSPMYDSIPFDSSGNKLLLADVGLMSLYIMDCEALSDIAGALNERSIQSELLERASKYRYNLNKLWSEKKGIYLNKRLDNNEFSDKISPTNFYPLLAQAPTQKQAERMIKEHFFNPEEFYGKYMLPSIAFNDPGYENDYWRGRIWAPMNFLVYLGLRNYKLPVARKELVKKSRVLFLEQWQKNGYVCENYNAKTGECDDVRNCDLFYHWGALLGFMDIIDKGYVPSPQLQLAGKK
ncbi:MAG: trehalase family glycosidase [Ginsengibacter sp.]